MYYVSKALHDSKFNYIRIKIGVITVSRSTWMTIKINGVATDLFCTGAIGHSESVFLN